MASSDAVLLLAVLAASGSQTTPTLPGGGAIVAWIICNRRKREAIGGWLLLYFWQVYSGLVVSAVFFSFNIQSYIPENFDSGTRFTLFLASVVPSLVLLLVQAAVATLLLSVQTWGMLRLLRWILFGQIVAGVIGLAIDFTNSPDNAALSIFGIIPDALWLAYFFRSTRVHHVFNQQDWDVAVKAIYPLNLKIAT